SMCSSCTTACSSIATRVSCGVTLMRISWLIVRGPCVEISLVVGEVGGRAGVPSAGLIRMVADPAQKPRGFVQRQPHHAAVAAGKMCHERGGASLDAIASGLVEGFAAGDVARD